MNSSISHRLLRTARLPSALTLGLLAVLSLFSGSSLHADTLEDVRTSRELNKIINETYRSRTAKPPEAYWSEGMERGSNFASIWHTGKSPGILLNWLSVNLPKYLAGPVTTKRGTEYAYARTTISSLARQRVEVLVMVPHPTYRTMVQYKTIPKFSELEPPHLPVKYEEAVPLRDGIKGTFYQTTHHQCSIHVKLPHFSVVNLTVKSCDQSELLMSVAKLLDFDRLSKKLLS